MVEDLNKTQLVLLTLLISFVTSIATGIITFSLLQQAPQTVTQTINRVVEQTIQQVSPSPSNPTPTKVTTVVVKEGDEIISSISKNTGSIVRIKNNNAAADADPFYSVGIVLSKAGHIVAPVSDGFNPGFVYSATFPDASVHQLAYVGQDKTNKLAFFKVSQEPGQDAFNAGVPAVFADDGAKLGQTVILVEGKDKNVVSIGHVSDFTYGVGSDSKVISGLETDIVPKTTSNGGLLLNLSGQIVGFRSSPSMATSLQIYISSNFAKDTVTEFIKK